MSEEKKGSKPIFSKKCRGISLAIFQNSVKNKEGKDVDVFNLTLKKNYKDKEGNWKDTTAIPLTQVGAVQYLLNEAANFFYSGEYKPKADAPAEEDESIEEEVQ